MSRHARHYYAVIPAAGTGSRFGAGMPKQYLPLNGAPLIQHTLQALLSDARIAQVVVVLSPDDTHWHEACLPTGAAGRVRVVHTGGATRADSVVNGIKWLQSNLDVNQEDWVLVHDAARPCLMTTQLADLIDALADDPVGGLLAIPVADTLKRGDTAARVMATVDRQQLWQAQTPQMFRLGLLQLALTAALADPETAAAVTDEASAIEMLGHQPRLVPGAYDNFKVTWPGDFALAERLLSTRP